MANLSFYNTGQTSSSWTISGLSEPFVPSMYLRAGITVNQFSNGYSGELSYSSSTIPSVGGGYSTSGVVSWLRAGTLYRFYGFAQAKNGCYYVTDGGAVKELMMRPDYFQWSSEKVSGNPFYLAAAEWERLCIHINSLRAWRGLQPYAFPYTASGMPFTAYAYNSARSALSSMTGALPPAASSGTPVYASYLNALRDAANGI